MCLAIWEVLPSFREHSRQWLTLFSEWLRQGVWDGSWHPDTQNTQSNRRLQKRMSLWQHSNKEAATNNCSRKLRLLGFCSAHPRTETDSQQRQQDTSHSCTACFLYSHFPSACRWWLVSEDMPSFQRARSQMEIRGDPCYKVFSPFKSLTSQDSAQRWKKK